MKSCLACGSENPDVAARCQACGTQAFVSSSSEAVGGHIISPAEKAFWERMGFGLFAVVVIRVGAFWLAFNALLAATQLPFFWQITASGKLSPLLGHHLLAWLQLFRPVFYLAAALVCFMRAPNIVNWLCHHSVILRTQLSARDEQSEKLT